jgi:hypothetical protein
MPNRRKQSKLRRVSLVIKTPARLIYEFDNISEERRVRTKKTASIIRTVKTYLGSVARVSDDLAITDILSDLRHYCDIRGMAFKKLDKAARALYLEAKTYEATWFTPAG